MFPVNIKASELVKVQFERSVTKMTKIFIEINTIVIFYTGMQCGRVDGFNPGLLLHCEWWRSSSSLGAPGQVDAGPLVGGVELWVSVPLLGWNPPGCGLDVEPVAGRQRLTC